MRLGRARPLAIAVVIAAGIGGMVWGLKVYVERTIIQAELAPYLFSKKYPEKQAQHDLKSILDAAEMWHASTGHYPESLDALKTGKDKNGRDIGVSLDNTKDPWGNEYQYWLSPEGTPCVRCLGADSMEGGEGENKDFMLRGGPRI